LRPEPRIANDPLKLLVRTIGKGFLAAQDIVASTRDPDEVEGRSRSGAT